MSSHDDQRNTQMIQEAIDNADSIERYMEVMNQCVRTECLYMERTKCYTGVL